MKEPNYYRARIKLIQRLMYKELQDAGEKSPVYRALQNGFIPEKYASEVAKLETLQEDEPNYALSPLEVATLDTYFAMYPEKVAGTTRVGSGFMRATEVIGTRADVDKVFSFLTTKKMENQSEGLKAGQTIWVRLDGKVRQATVMNDFLGGLTTNDEVPLSIDLGGARSLRNWKVKNVMLEKPAESKYTTGQWVMYYKELRTNGDTTSRKVYGQITRMSQNASGEYTYQMDEPKAVVTDYVNPSQDIRQRQFILDENASYDFTDSDEVDVLSKSDIDDFVRDFRLRAQSSEDYGYTVIGPKELLGVVKKPDPAPVGEPASQTAIIGVGAIDKVALAAAITRSKEKSDNRSDNPNAAPLLSFDEVIDLYNPGISESELKAWVWYKQSFGVPMTGWEKYFITSKTKGTGENLVHAKETVDLLDNFFRKVRSVPPGTVIGKRTKFKNEYDKENYLVVRTEQNELLYVAESKVTEKKAEYLVDETALEKLIKEKALIYFDGSLLPVPVYTFGNMYEREKQLEKDRTYIVEMYGESHYEFAKQLIEENKPVQLRVESPDKSLRPKILALSRMSNDPTIFSIKELSEESGISLPNPKNKRMDKDDPENRYSLREAYEIWLDTIKDTDIPNSSKDYIRDYYLSQKRFPEEMPESKRTEIQANARLAAETLFSEFLASGLLYEDQLKLNRIWNETYNSFSQVNKYRVPVGFTCSRTFKNSLLSIRPVQREGVAFMNIVGSGCLAYDVGVGKAQPLDAKILTPTGWKTMGEMKVGSLVIGSNGMPTRVTGVFPQGKKDIFRVTFSDGSQTECCKEHLWQVQTINHRAKYPESFVVKTLEEIIATLHNYRGDRQYSIPLVKPVEFKESALPLDPYLMGVLLGDGMFGKRSVYLSTKDPETTHRITPMLPEGVRLRQVSGSEIDYQLTTGNTGQKVKNQVLSTIRELGLENVKSYDKFIPDVYKFSSATSRLKLLQGLLDTDGTVGKRKTGCHVSFSSTSKKLIDDVTLLVQSFGGTVSVTSRIPRYSHNGETRQGRLAYNLTITLPPEIIPFTLERKLAYFVPKSKYKPVRFITQIEPIGQKVAQCIAVDAPDHLYVTDDFIVTHNTMTAIIILAMKIQSGECNRALLAVPKPTYQKWKRELFGYYTSGQKKSDTPFDGATYVTGILSFTGIKLNDWQNLGTAVVEKLGNKLDETLPEKSITMVTFEGLAKIGFSKKVFDSIFDDLVDILYNGGNQESYRQKQIEYSKYREMMGKGIKGTVTDIDVIGIDYLVVDEAHNFKNVFETVGRDKEQKRNLFGLKGAQSDRAVKLFFLSQYIQRQYGKKVCLLTATPFTNSPLEIFSMLSFIGYETLREYNLQNIRRFFELFVLESFEYTVSLRDTIDVKPVIKSFNNRLVLQKLLYNHFDYKTGADAGIVRPCKINFPLIKIQTTEGYQDLPPEKQVTTYLDMTEAQMVNQRDVVQAARTAGYDNPGQMFRALARSLDNAFSPYLFESTVPDDDLTPQEFVENSPKIYYSCECIRSVKAYHESRKESVSGQVIYSNRGKEYFRLIKAYLEMSVGYQKRVPFGETRLDEVEILDSEVSEKKKDDIKEAFLNGVVKIIIGTATIKEGIDLQTRGTVLYNLYPDWNPTDMQQLEGRIYRQGNQFGYVRIVQPLVVNSMDVFVFQKLEEKTARLNTIWSRQGKTNVLDMDALDVEEIKYALIDNPAELTNMRVQKEIANLGKEVTVAEENLKMYGMLKNLIYSYNYYRGEVVKYANLFYDNMKRNITISQNAIDNPDTDKERVKKYKIYLEKFEKMTARMEAFFNAVPQSDRELLDIMRSIRSTDWGYIVNSYPEYQVNNFRNYFSQVAKAERQILKAYDLTIDSDLAPLKEKLEDIIRGVKERIEYVSSADYSQVVYQQVQAELDKRRAVRGTVEEQVAKFKQTNLVLSYPADNVDRNNCIIPEEECCTYNPSQVKEPEYYNGENEATPITEQVGAVAEPVILTPEQELQEISEAVEVLELLLEDSESESEKAEIKEAIEVLELLLEDMQIIA
jgi:hypothetical protein